MKILITGSHGFVGSNLVIALKDHELDLWDRKNSKSLKKLSKRSLQNVDAVIHLAASISVPQSYKEPLKYYKNNTFTTAELVFLAAQAGVKKFIFASSSSVYADPLSPYGASKLAAENLLDPFKDQMKIHRLRFFNIYGPGQNREYPGVITKIIHALREDKEFEINGDGTQTRDFTYVGDVVKTIKYFLENDVNVADPIDAAGAKPRSLNEIIELLEKISGKKLKIKRLPEAKEIKHSKASLEIAAIVGEFTPLEKGLRLTYETV